ncbi:unnamed protein product [Phytophthora fragariaefolia]|uniref:Unnamed protein product n=1 Tax=Phytophthora fragariaefolia TaxID=1490495 RepID=A0A9W6WV83_9STRA|nr:unnamed protein product [Phytophthora fragariaefolia]
MRLLKETGIIAESFEAEALFDLKLSEIEQSAQSLFELLAPLVGEPDQTQKQLTQSKSTATRSTLTAARSTPIVAPGDQTAASSPYVSATEEAESSDSEESPRMTLGPAGAAMLQNRAKQTAGLTTKNPRDTLEAMMNSNRHPPEKLREHVEHFIETLDDRDLVVQLALLRIPDADTREEVLRSRQRAKSRQSKTVYGSIKPRQKPPAAAADTRAVRAVHVPDDSSDSDEESRSSSDEDLRRVYIASRSQQDKSQDQRIRDQTQESHQQDRHISQYPRQTDEGASSK